MHCLQPPRSLAPPARGFTLLELMVVVLIMGVIVGLVSVNLVPDEGSKLKVEAQRLAQLLDLVAEEARVSGASFAWIAKPAGYAFEQKTADNAWQSVPDNDLLRARQLPAGISIHSLKVENNPVPGTMRVEFSAYGQTTAFAVELHAGAARCLVSVSPLGSVQVELLAAAGSDDS